MTGQERLGGLINLFCFVSDCWSIKRVIVSTLSVYRNWKLINFTLICFLCSVSNIYIEFILIARVV